MEYWIESWDKLDNLIGVTQLDSLQKHSDEFVEIRRLLNFDLGLKLPLSIRKRERPDFEVSEAGGTRKIGIEHTWAIHKGWKESVQYLLKEKDPAYKSVSRNWLEGEQAHGRKLGQKIVEKQGLLPIWSDREQADAKAEEVKLAFRKKLDDLFKDGFEKYPENWLFIFDHCPFLFLNLDYFRKKLAVNESLFRSGYSRVLFLTQVKERKRNKNLDILIDLSCKDLSLVGHRT